MASKLSHKQFGDSYRKEDFRSKEHGPRDDADRVYALYAHDYPKHALHWVHDLDWDGPKRIPLSKIDRDNEKSWRASREHAKVHHFAEMIQEAESNGEHIKPVALVKRPGHKDLMAPDGHHRIEGYADAGLSWVWGYEGKAKNVMGPWDYLHDSQFKDTPKDIRNRR